MSKQKIFRLFGIVSVLAVCAFMASCATKAAKRTSYADRAFDNGDYVALVDSLKKHAKILYGETNLFLYYMDRGVLYHYAGMYDSSSANFNRAADVYEELFTKSVTNEAAALLTNDNVRPYRSKPYELVMMHQFAALNYMAQGKFDEALVETRRVQIHFNEWERTRANRYHTDGMSHLFSSLNYEKAGERDNSLISLYKSVEAYKKGPVPLPAEVEGFAYDRLKAGDRENDISTLKISPQNDEPNKWTAKPGQAEIVIVGYAGRGPNMKEQNWWGTYYSDGDLYLSTRNRPYGRSTTYRVPAPPLPDNKSGRYNIKLSLPEMYTEKSRTSYFSARLDGGDGKFESVALNDFNVLAQKELDDSWGEIIGRMVVRAVLREITAAQTQKAADKAGSPVLSAVVGIGSAIAKVELEKADTRMCFFLPQSIQAIRIPVEPGTHDVTLSVHGFRGDIIGRKRFDGIEVKNGEKKVLIHNSLQ